MGKATGRESDRRAVDMSTLPQEDEYRPPPRAACEELTVPIAITATDRLHVRMWLYRGKIVDFAVMQFRVDDSGNEVEVARVDCAHGTIHVHQFTRRSGERQRVMYRIPPGNGWEFVNNAYEEAYGLMFDDWEENLRRWDS